ncbi:MAG TPA: hypothetical protein VLE74_00215, partial [Candidatus Saccharimonadales bacterium]|nr:hypothetical protein [Candidatus Saccharimonadales bacterium]
ITLQWQAQNGSADFTCPDSGAGTPNFPDLPPAGGWTCGTGILRVDLVPFGSSATRNDLDDSLFNAFLYPQASGGVASTTYNGAGTQLKANNFKVTCSTANTPKFCKFTISNIKALVGGTYGNTYRAYLRVKSVYIASSLTISATTNSGNPASFSGTQVMIDSTGKANDVLRRIQVRVPVNLSGILPDSPLDTSGSICKRYLVGASSVSDPDGCGF